MITERTPGNEKEIPPDILALATQLRNIQDKKPRQQPNQDNKYKWKLVPPKDGEKNVKKVFQDGEKKTYYWCQYHQMWTKHTPQECKKYPTRNRLKGKSYKDKRKV
jgi:hypothetical protein